MRAWIRIAPLTLFSATALAEARPDASWLAVHAPAQCDMASAGLAERVNDALLGERVPDVRASVTIEAASPGYEVTLRTMRGAVDLGTKVLSVPTCDEAADVAVVVLALALSEANVAESAGLEENAEIPESVSIEPLAVAPLRAPASETALGAKPAAFRPVDDGGNGRARVDASSGVVRAAFLTGVDAGTLPLPTIQAAVGVTRTFGRAELRGTVRYGLPYEEEELDNGQSSLERHEFGALELDACYALGTRFRLSGCAGGELAVVLRERRLKNEAGLEDDHAAEPRLAGVLTALFAHRGGTIQPELELSSAIAAAGRQDEARLVTFRAAAGVAVQF